MRSLAARRLLAGLSAGLLAALPAAAAAAPASAPTAPGPSVQAGPDDELEALLAEERAEADRLRRRGRPRAALEILDEHLEEEPADAAARHLRALARRDLGQLEGALEDARRAVADAPESPGGASAALRAACARVLVDLLTDLGRPGEALAAVEAAGGALRPEADGRDAWVVARALGEAGERERAAEVLTAGSRTPERQPWEGLLGKARCLRALQRYELASHVLVAADRAATAAGGPEPDVLVELGDLYFEVDGEVDHAESASRKPAELYKEALALNAVHEGALLGLFELHDFNWNRQSRSAESWLAELFAHDPHSLRGLVAGVSGDLNDGRLKSARERLATLAELAPGRRDVRTAEAALAWIEHRRDDALAILEELAAVDPRDGRPERRVGGHLLELYRFVEAEPFLRRAVERDPRDFEAWIGLGRALANTGREGEARAALAKADEISSGRKNAWRHNMAMVLERMERTMVEQAAGDLTFVWRPEAAPILETYLVPFYTEARADLSKRYGFTSGPVRIEVFGSHPDFSVRSVGFGGFPALGVCFGPVVTSVSPLSELRGTYSWARTAYHEFTHVIHLGLSHNRCPRWITEGLATWEETARNPAWTRNMRRELLDARANGELIAVRDLNGAFRSSRILFGYYQGGLLCDLLIGEHGFPPMVRLLEAFDRGLDLDQALDEVFGLAPEEIDARFRVYVDRHLAGLELEPRWTPGRVRAIRLGLRREPPPESDEPGARAAWAEDWCTVAWGSWQAGRTIDAEEALRLLDAAGELPARGHFLRGEMAIQRGDEAAAAEHWRAGLAAGGNDYRVRMSLARLAMGADDEERAEAELLAAERAFPGFDAKEFSAELTLAALYERQGRTDEAMAARERWLAWNAGELPTRLIVARWHADAGRPARAAEVYAAANEVDPFSAALHLAWGRALLADERPEEALREFRVAAQVPPAFDLDPGFLDDERRATLAALEGECLERLGRRDEAREAARRALDLDDGCEAARELLERLE